MLIGIDGVRPDVLRRVPTPHLDSLIADGAFSDRAQTGLPTVSGPSWASMLTGVWKEKHGIVSNDFPFPRNGLDRYPDFLTRVERRSPGLRTFAVADWLPLVDSRAEPGAPARTPVVSDAVDRKLVLDGSDIGWAAADERSVDAAVEELGENDPAALFVYLGNPDEVSHHTGSIEDEYRASLARADRMVGRLVRAIRSRPTYARESWLILVATDHGRLPDGSHGGETAEERTIFYLASGEAAERGTLAAPPAIVDVAATALSHLGLYDEARSDLDGVPVGLARR
jgi:predicted AlkP superfamily pyrophosphatase or phosphodiesterase